MKRIILAVGVMVGLLIAGKAQALLIDRGNGLIYDNVLNITWLQDANYAQTSGFDTDGMMNWANANAWAANLVYQGFSDWRLASMSVAGGLPTGAAASVVDCSTATEVACRDNEYGYMFYQNLNGAAGNNKTGSQLGDGGVTLNNIQFVYWSGTEFAPNAVFAWDFFFLNGDQRSDNKFFSLFGWAVRPGDSLATTVPEPASILLLGAGLSALLGVRRLRR